MKVVNAIIKDNNKFLLIKRKKGEIHEEKWAFPGGILENNETIEQALKREVKEETGLEIIEIVKKVSEYSYKRKDRSLTNGECYFVKTKNTDIKIDEKEIQEYKWASLEEFEQLDHIPGLDEEALETFL